MEKLSSGQIKNIGEEIFSNSDVIAQHGTSIANALSIMEDGLYYSISSIIMNRNKNIQRLCTYSWKDNVPGDVANVIICVPKSFMKIWFKLNDEQYDVWINKQIELDNLENFLYCISNVEPNPYKKVDEENALPYNVSPSMHIPREFIKGAFIYTDNKNSLSFTNREEAFNHLTYVDNKNYYDNLSKDDQKDFMHKLYRRFLSDHKGRTKGSKNKVKKIED